MQLEIQEEHAFRRPSCWDLPGRKRDLLLMAIGVIGVAILISGVVLAVKASNNKLLAPAGTQVIDRFGKTSQLFQLTSAGKFSLGASALISTGLALPAFALGYHFGYKKGRVTDDAICGVALAGGTLLVSAIALLLFFPITRGIFGDKGSFYLVSGILALGGLGLIGSLAFAGHFAGTIDKKKTNPPLTPAPLN